MFTGLKLDQFSKEDLMLFMESLYADVENIAIALERGEERKLVLAQIVSSLNGFCKQTGNDKYYQYEVLKE